MADTKEDLKKLVEFLKKSVPYDDVLSNAIQKIKQAIADGKTSWQELGITEEELNKIRYVQHTTFYTH